MEDDDTLEALMAQLGIGQRDPMAAQRERFTSRPPAIDPSSMQSVAGQYAPRVRREDLRPLPTRQEQSREYERLQQAPREAQAYQAPMNQFADAGNQVLEGTGLPSIRRSAAAFADGRPREGFGEGALGLTSLATLGVGGRSMQPRSAHSMPRMADPALPRQPTRIYRGIVPDESRRSALGDRWWSDNPETASSYAPGAADGAYVVPGSIDESAMNLLHVEAPPGTMFRSIPVRSLPPELRRAFPRSTETVSTHEVAATAESLGYEGVTFRGIRDGGYGGASSEYGGFGSGDPGRVFALFDPERSARSPFNAPVAEPRVGALRPPPQRPAGSVLPMREPEPFRNSMRGGSDDLMDAASPQARPALDAGNGGGGQRLYRGVRQGDALDGEGPLYLHRDPSAASEFAGARIGQDGRPLIELTGEGGNVMPITADIRNPVTVTQQEMAALGYEPYRVRQLAEQGYDAAVSPNGEVLVFDRSRANPSLRTPRAPDGGNAAAREQLQADGFHVDQPIYRGMTQPLSGDSFARDPSRMGSEGFPGVSFSRSGTEASLYAEEGGGGVVYPAFYRGDLADGAEYMRAVRALARERGVSNLEAAELVQREYASRGITGVEWAPNQYGQGGEVRIFDPDANMRSAIGPNAPARSPSPPRRQ